MPSVLPSSGNGERLSCRGVSLCPMFGAVRHGNIDGLLTKVKVRLLRIANRPLAHPLGQHMQGRKLLLLLFYRRGAAGKKAYVDVSGCVG